MIIGAVIGALTGLGLSFTSLSPLVMGGIIATVSTILAFCASVIYNSGERRALSKKDIFTFACLCVTGASIGVGLAAATTTIFPGAMLGMGPAILTSAVIEAIALKAVFPIVDYIIEPIAGKVNEYIISHIMECFSQKGKEV